MLASLQRCVVYSKYEFEYFDHEYEYKYYTAHTNTDYHFIQITFPNGQERPFA